jgi:hypothetical protein
MTQLTQPLRPDPIGDFQRWLLKSSAKGFGREVRGNLRRTFGRPSEEDVWSQATREIRTSPRSASGARSAGPHGSTGTAAGRAWAGT